MTKEQEEAIEYVQKQIDYYKEQIKFIEAVDSDYYDEEYELYKNRVKQFETVLNIPKERDEKIEYYKKQKNYDDQFKHELLEQIRCLNLDKDEKDKQIDLMAEKINEAYFEENDFYLWFEKIFGIIPKGNYKEEIKQHFEKVSNI